VDKSAAEVFEHSLAVDIIGENGGFWPIFYEMSLTLRFGRNRQTYAGTG
jgi:hypothetical protein